MPTGRPADRAAPLPGAAPGLAACRRSRRAALGPAPDPAAAWRSALLLALNPDTLTIEHAVALTDQPAPGSDDIAFAGGLIWVAGTRSLTAVNPAAATITAGAAPGTGQHRRLHPSANFAALGRGAPVTSTIVIGPGETFAPPPARAKPKLNGVRAWDKSFLGDFGKKPGPIPADISYQLGLLTIPPSVTDVLAWGYSSPPGPCPRPMGTPDLGRSQPASPPPSPRGRCIQWTFINASNAGNPAGTWQRLHTPPPTPSPTPTTVIVLHSGGFVGTEPDRFSPQRLVVQEPLSTIRWTFTSTTCSIDLYWFMPPQLQRGPARAACPWQHAFTLNVVTGFTSRGRVFSVVAGYVAHRMHDLVRAVLANGRSWTYDAQNADAMWLFAVQRCGDYPGTALRKVQEINAAGRVIATLPVPADPSHGGAANCR